MIQNQMKVIDMKLPLSWLISAFATVVLFMASMVWNIAGQSNKLDQLIITNQKMEKRLDDRDVKTEDMRDRLFNFDRTTDNLKLRVDALERQRIK